MTPSRPLCSRRRSSGTPSARTSARSSSGIPRRNVCSIRCCSSKAFHAIETHRLAHWLWLKGRRDLALYLQSRSSEVFQTDIHPAAFFGRGIFLDHATGLVVGATAVVEDNVSILHAVTLGGTGRAEGDRHPKIRSGVLIGAGAKILGPVEVGRCARIAAGSVVMSDVAPDTTVAGVPATAVGSTRGSEPSRDMEQMLSAEACAVFDYVI